MSKRFVPLVPAEIDWQEKLPRSTFFDDIYFDSTNALNETKYVFIDGNNLISRWQNLKEDSFIIAETGFGSGLNFLLSWHLWLLHAPIKAALTFVSTEKFPLKKDDLRKILSLFPELSSEGAALLEAYPTLTPGYHYLSFANGRIRLILMLGDAEASFRQLLLSGDAILESELRTNSLDAIFLDGFTPKKNEELWSLSLFQTLALLSKKGTTLATFSAAGLVRRNLIAAGFKVNKCKGHADKREMIIADFDRVLDCQQKLRTTPWQVDAYKKTKNKKAIIVGAGLAGSYLAYALATRGWQVKLLDANSEPGLGASANEQAVLYPKLSAFASPLTEFMLSAFLYAKTCYKEFLEKGAVGELSGILQLAFSEKEELWQQSLSDWLLIYPELGVLVNADEASRLSGIPLKHSGIFIPDSGWLNSKYLCQMLTKTKGIDFIGDCYISDIHFADNLWHVGNESAEVLIIANGYQAKQFKETAFLPLKPIRGQMTQFEAKKTSLHLKIPICGEGHVLPAFAGRHACGASYHLGSIDETNYEADDFLNLAKTKKLTKDNIWSLDIKASWVGIRGMTTDYLPLVGAVPNAPLFKERFQNLSTNAKRFIPLPGVFYQGLYLCAGFGSRGLTTIPLSAEWLASQLNRELSFIPQNMVKALAPARFLCKAIVTS